MAKALKNAGWEVSLWGVNDPDGEQNWESAICGANIIVLPLPASDDGVRIRSQTDTPPRFRTLLEKLDSDKVIILGGKIPELWLAAANKQGIEIHDYFHSETLQMKNALPTVEGAICIAMTELPVTLCATQTAVIGYGRIASLLAERLLSLGSEVTVYARNPRDVAHAQIRGLHAKQLIGEGESSTLCEISSDCRVIFNTVPRRILSDKILKALPSGCLLMELASFPGGFDFQEAEGAGLKPLLASALPGKLFPESAGKSLAETVQEFLSSSRPPL